MLNNIEFVSGRYYISNKCLV